MQVFKIQYVCVVVFLKGMKILPFTLLKRRIWCAPNIANRWQVGFKSAFKGLTKEFKVKIDFPALYFNLNN
jgi:hypothetical protein